VDTVSGDFEELFAEAEQNLKEQEVPDEWGPLRQTTEEERLLARYLGRVQHPLYGDDVFRFVTYPGYEPFYLRYKTKLAQVLEGANAGDITGLVRGRDRDIGKDNPMETWAGWARPCDEPLASTAVATESGIPF
jgi:hypothetical protein